ncbi:band 4.1-like protein 2 isoform X9 [Amblyraja radiata]|uniref:band 4.1-like protein 2 isoform X9 n=1 Tax=Amblyraja radiata TaxID=386614 RepID=UPI00140286F3|nr:band 4.1-like protein 2 isoform X9 [Amblyraja radiata]
MTTEVGSAIQVNEESKGTEPDDSEASNPDKTSNGNEEAEKEIQEDEQPESTTQPLKEQEFNSSISDASTQSTPSSSDKKDPTGGKGLFRFLPGWLKKPKSMSQVETTEEKEAEEDIQTKDRNSEDEQPELMKSTSENEVVKGMETEESKTDEIVEQYSLNSAELQTDLQTDKAKKPEESLEKDADMDNEEVVLDEKKDENSKDGEVWKDEDASKKSPLKIPKKIKFMQSKVFMLDGSEFTYEIEKHAKGQIMLDKVCEQINLLEKDYFGLTFRDATGEKNWLDPAKEIKKQIRSCAWHFNFNVKFYPPDPSQLTEDITRYYLCLQLRQDIVSGRLPCSFVTHALLGSCALQAELGDYDANEHKAGYVTELQFSPNQTKELEEKISELHKTHRGLTPAQADAQFLENAKMLSMYGVDLHHAKDSEGVDIMLGVCANGLLIYKDRLRINRFAWPKILKISYKRSNFYIKIRPGEIEQFESTIGFKLPNHRAAKRLWKVCVEHHTFFRLLSPEQTPKSKFMTLGSKFRYSGRTQAQTREASILIDRPAPFFERTSSKRMSRSLDGVPAGGINEVGLQQESSCLSSTADGVKTEADALAIKDITTSLKASQLEMPVETKSLEEEITSLLLSKESFSTGLVASFSSTVSQALEDAGLKEKAAAESVSLIDSKQLPETSDENQKSEMEEQAEVIVEEAIVIEEVKSAPGHSKVKLESPVENSSIVPPVELAAKESNVSSSDSRSDSEEEAEYHPQTKEGENVKRDQNECKTLTTVAMDSEISVTDIEEVHFPVTVVHKMQDVLEEDLQEMQNGKLQEAKQEHEDINPKLNGDVSFIDSDAMPEVVCYAEPPVVKTEMVTISDTVSPDKTEIATKEVPIVQTETKTITYEAAQGDGSGDNDPGVLMSAQTITSESFCQTMTTQITKTVKGGVSETRIEKRIVITGDTDIDHDQALAQAIKEAKEQHPDMSVTRVVVHKETELTEDGDE